MLKDDKSFSTIFISTDHAFPQISSHRGKRSKKGEYFGPFISKGAIVKTIETIQKAFLLKIVMTVHSLQEKIPIFNIKLKDAVLHV